MGRVRYKNPLSEWYAVPGENPLPVASSTSSKNTNVPRAASGNAVIPTKRMMLHLITKARSARLLAALNEQ